jgi:hypothetical protein
VLSGVDGFEGIVSGYAQAHIRIGLATYLLQAQIQWVHRVRPVKSIAKKFRKRK